MNELLPIADAAPVTADTTGLPLDTDAAPRTPLAWLEIESLTFGDFKQVVRVPFCAGQIIAIGRDSKKCHLRFQNKAVSSVHCEIYSVIFDEEEQYPTLIYVRDCQSASGTFVNGDLVGKGPLVSQARLLENNDTISVGPCSLRLCDYSVGVASSPLSPLQRAEASLFADQFLVKDMILGSGSFANVYLALNVKTKQQLICKVHDLPSLRKRYSSAIASVDREMSIWSQLDHPNIIAFHRAFRTSNTMFTFADLAAGGDLFSLLKRERTLPELEIKWMLFQVLRAVDYLHCKGVAHRDIKPENVLCYSSLHTHHRIALADFGCAGVTSLGRLTSHVGTSAYRAPEAQVPAQPHGVAVDIWSIGVLALQLLSGNDPVDALGASLTESDIENIVLLINIRRAGQHNGPISQAGVDFIVSCLNPQPLARPSATNAAKHLWFRESAHQILQFKEREKQLTWKPRGIIFPAVVSLPDHRPNSPAAEFPAAKRVRREDDGDGLPALGANPITFEVKRVCTLVGERAPDSASSSRESSPESTV